MFDLSSDSTVSLSSSYEVLIRSQTITHSNLVLQAQQAAKIIIYSVSALIKCTIEDHVQLIRVRHGDLFTGQIKTKLSLRVRFVCSVLSMRVHARVCTCLCK